MANPAINEAGRGLFYGNPKQLWIQIVSIVATAVFTAVGTIVVTYLTKFLTGGLRVEEESEILGLDNSLARSRTLIAAAQAALDEYADEASKLEVHLDTDEGNACFLDSLFSMMNRKRRNGYRNWKGSSRSTMPSSLKR